MHLGTIISEYRAKNRLSMDDFANRSGLSKSYISMLEKNINPSTGKEIAPTIDAIKKVANAMNMDFNDLFKLLEDDTISLDDKELTIDPRFNDFRFALMHGENDLTEDQKQDLLDYYEFIKSKNR